MTTQKPPASETPTSKPGNSGKLGTRMVGPASPSPDPIAAALGSKYAPTEFAYATSSPSQEGRYRTTGWAKVGQLPDERTIWSKSLIERNSEVPNG